MITFALGADVYDIEIEIPTGYELAPNWANPVRGVQVATLGQAWVGFILRSTQ